MNGDLIKELQAVELEMLKAVAQICDENDIAYFLDSGTLLGAIRHEGFIPWDDDIDICMDVKNYRKFLKAAPKLLPEKYFLQNCHTDPRVAIRWSKIRVNNTATIERPLISYDIHHGVSMDIFVMAGVANSAIGKRIQVFASNVMNILLSKYSLQVQNKKISGKLDFFYRVLPEALRLWLISVFEEIVCHWDKSEYYFNLWYSDPFDGKTMVWPKSFFNKDNRVKKKFEDDEFWVTADYEAWLTIRYGNWRKLPPESERTGHGDMIIDLHNSYKKYLKL